MDHINPDVIKAITEIALKRILLTAAIYFLIGAILLGGAALFKNIFKIGWDDTDGSVRSQMIIRIDHGTGLQYLESQKGGLTPRLDQQGQHMRATE